MVVDVFSHRRHQLVIPGFDELDDGSEAQLERPRRLYSAVMEEQMPDVKVVWICCCCSGLGG